MIMIMIINIVITITNSNNNDNEKFAVNRWARLAVAPVAAVAAERGVGLL